MARQQWRQVAHRLAARFPKLAALMAEAEHDVLAYIGFHADHRTKLNGNNPLEHLNGEIKRRTNVVDIFPNEAIVRLVGAILLEQNDEWAVTKRCLSLETMLPLSDDPTVNPPALAAA